jgi:GT2 family glycosyltransferase
MADSTADILLVTVCYRNEEEVNEFHRKYGESLDSNGVKRFIVINALQNPSSAIDWNNDSSCYIIITGNNEGYLGAFRIALEHWKKKENIWPELAILCNTDISITPDTLINSLREAAKIPSAGLVGPSIRSTLSNVDQNPFMMDRMTPASLKLLLTENSFYPFYLAYQTLSYIKRFFKRNGEKTEEVKRVYALHGACIGITRLMLDKCFARFKEAGFLYGEEIFLAELCHQNGLSAFYHPGSQVEHREHTTTGRYKSVKHIRYLHDSLSRIEELFFKPKGK